MTVSPGPTQVSWSAGTGDLADSASAWHETAETTNKRDRQLAMKIFRKSFESNRNVST
jgi:hypothetical protein